MPVIEFHGQRLRLDVVYSYARVSTSRQTEEHGGQGIQRQIRLAEKFSADYGVPLDHQLTDLGKSASKGKHLEAGSALGVFMELAQAKPPKLAPHAGLLVESFTRLERLPIDDAMGLFLDLVKAGVTLITLETGRSYSKESIRRNQGEIFEIAAAMNVARSLADTIGYYSTQSWKYRRDSASNVLPAWITKTVDGVPVDSIRDRKKGGAVLGTAIDEAKGAIVRRICDMAMTMGVNQTAYVLNREGVPTLTERKRQRGVLLWDRGSLRKLLRGRQLIGEQEVCHYVDGKRQRTGEYRQAYPALIERDQWLAIQAKIDGRKSGTATGRNVTQMTNLWGDLARCECRERMKVHRRGDAGQYVYLGCSAAYVGGCDNKKFYRLDKLDAKLLPKIEVFGETEAPSQDDPAADLRKKITTTKKQIAKLEADYEPLFVRHGTAAPDSLPGRSLARLQAEQEAKVAELANLERDLARLLAEPVDAQRAVVRTLYQTALTGDGEAKVAARRLIANALPALVTGVTCLKDGTVHVAFTTRTVPIAWRTRLD